jgi:hypothetical protein
MSLAPLPSFFNSGSHFFHLRLPFCFLRFLHRLPGISIFPHSLFTKRAVPSPVICISKERQLNYGRESVEDFLDWYAVPFGDFSKRKEILTRLGNIDNSTKKNRLAED